MDKAKVDDCLKNLKASPMFHFSLASKELFHSNFIDWISTITIGNNKIGEQILRSIFPFAEGDFKVKREWNHFDLTACTPDTKKPIPMLVVENKLKSVPSLKQINEYNEKLEKLHSSPDRYLLTMMTDFPDKEAIQAAGWNIVYYDQLRYKLLEFLGKIKETHPEFEKQYTYSIIEDYCTFISNLETLCKEFTVGNDDNFLICPKYREQLEELRIYDLVDKLRLSAFAEKVREIIPGAQIRTGYGHVNAMMEIWCPEIINLEKAKKSDCKPSLVIAVQGDRYSHAIYPCKNLSEKDCVAKFPGFFADDIEEFRKSFIDSEAGVFEKMQKKGKNNFCKFVSINDYPYLYQNVKISSKAKVGNILDRIKKDYAQACSMIGK